MAPSLDSHRTKVKRLTDKIAEARNVIQDPAHNVRMLSTKLQQLERCRSKVAELQGIPVEEFDFESECYIALDDAEDISTKLQGFLDELEKRAEKRKLEEQCETAIQLARARKPTPGPSKSSIKLTIPTFTGECEKYPNFRSAFMTAIEGEDMSKMVQLRVLEQHLQGRPAKLIENIKYSDEGFDQAMLILDETYNIKQRQRDAILHRIRSMPKAREDLASIRTNYEDLEAYLRALKEYQDIDETEDLRRLVMSKFAESTLDRISSTEIPTLQLIRSRLKVIIRMKEDQASVLDDIAATSAPKLVPIAAFPATAEPKNRIQFPTTAPEKASKTVKESQCKFCMKTGHPSESCFKYPTAKERLFSLPMGTCARCLGKEHEAKDCQNAVHCATCQSRHHHVLLCPKKFGWFSDKAKEKAEKKAAARKSASEKDKQKTEPATTTVALATQTQACYLTAMCSFRNPVTAASFYGRLFQDSGCNLTFILQQIALDLNLRVIDRVPLRVKVFLDTKYHDIISNIVELDLVEPSTGKAHRIRAHTVPRITQQLVALNAKGFKNRFPQLKQLEMVDEGNGEEISLLIGNNFLWNFLLPETKVKIAENLFVISTTFGHMIVGDHEELLAPNDTTASMHISTKPLNDLWSLDAIGITDKSITSAEEEQLALQQFNETIRWIQNEKRYEVGLPCRSIRPNVPSNYGMAAAILRALLRKYQKQPEYLRVCTKIFDEQLKEGIIERAPETENGENHYIPYKWIERPGKSTPIRIVYNASAKAKGYNSLNDELYKGVNLLADLSGILLRFRRYPTAVVSDIAKAFHQITIIPEHRDYLRFLWASEPENPDTTKLVSYRFRRLPFGVISSPFILAATILYHLSRHNTPVAQRIREDIYADNIITSFSSIEEAAAFYPQAMNMFDDAGLPLRQWHSNSPVIRDLVPEEFRDTKEVITVLGITWNTRNDTLSITKPDIEIDNDAEVTMLTVLQQSAKIYDPLGLFTPISITSRMFLQSLHAKQYDWNTPLDAEERIKWCELRRDHFDIPSFQFVRCMIQSETSVKSRQLHVFSDASDKAYGAAVYLRLEYKSEVSIHLLMAKARVTPLKSETKLTIPRLELMGALLASRLLRTVTEVFGNEFESRTLWCDSRCVLAWLSTSAALPAFVKNRIAEIRSVPNVAYRYVPSASNPADLASRGVALDELRLSSSQWWHGPEWLAKHEVQWPSNNVIAKSVEETFDPIAFVAAVPEIKKYVPLLDIEMSRYSRYNKLIRVTALVIQFCRNFKVVQKKRLFDRRLTSVEIATQKWIRNIQQHAFSDILTDLKENKKAALAKKLRLFADDDQIIRLLGRFHNAELTYEEKHPILLPKASNYEFVQLLIVDVHHSASHSSDVATLTAIRKKYWPLAGRKQVSAVLRNCRPCRRERARPYQQPSDSVLPPTRIDQAVAPFSHIGLDIAGHVWIRDAKKWVLLVTCLVTRAVLLEDLDNLESETVMYALQRVEAHTDGFMTYLSDNAPQFRLLRDIIQHQSPTPVHWHFLPAHMPWAGGAYERLVGLMKRSLLATLRDEVTVSALHFRTILQRIAGALNDRPLTYIGEKFDGEPLTPNKFLRRRFVHDTGQPLNLISETSTASFLRHQLKQTGELLNKFWNQWCTEYLQFLREREGTHQFARNTVRREPRIGDVVIIHDEVRKRRQWNLASVTQLQRSADNAVRSVVLRLGTGTKIIRPVEKIYYMELNEFESQGEPVPAPDASDDIDNIPVTD